MADISAIQVAPELNGQNYGAFPVLPPALVNSSRAAPELNGQNYGAFPVLPPALVSATTPNNFVPEQLTLLSAQESYLKLTLTFSDNISALQSPYNTPGAWVFSTSASPITSTGVSLSGPTITILHTEPTQGQNYTLAIPSAAINIVGRSKNIPSSTTFAGAGQSPIAYSVLAIDSTHIQIQFSEGVKELDAININNYTITPTLGILAALANSPSNYTLETNSQTPLQIYDLTIENIRDLQDNPILTPAAIPVQFFGFGSGGGPVTDPPVISDVAPTPGTSITGNQPITLRVTDDSGLALVALTVNIPSLGISEVIHNGIQFGSRYTNLTNSRAPIPFGYEYSLLRDGGWPGDVTLIPYVIDSEGQLP